MSMPKISVVMPSLNVRDYIEACIDSVTNQTLKDIEIICVDAGSTDGTLEVLKDYAQKDSRIRIINSDKKSYGYQVNLGFKESLGDYFAIVETDDIINLQMYEKLYKTAIDTGVDIVKANFCRFEIVDGVMKKKYAEIAKPHMYERILTAENDRTDIITNAALYTWSGIYRKDFLLQNKILHNETPGASYQDNGFWFQTMAVANTVYFMKDSFYMLRRDNPNSSIRNKGKVYCIKDEYEFVLEYLKNKPELYSQLIPYYWWARFGAYRYNYNRIALEHKEEFLNHFTEVFTPVWNSVEFDEKLFSKTSYNDLKAIVTKPYEYHKAKLKVAERENQKATYVRRFLWVVEDHGWGYAIKYGIKRLGNRLGYIDKEEKNKRQFIRPITKHIDKKTSSIDIKLDTLIAENQKLLLKLETYEKRLKALEEKL